MRDAIECLVEIDIKMVGLGSAGNLCSDVEKVVHGAKIWHAPVLAVVYKGVIFDEGLEGGGGMTGH